MTPLCEKVIEKHQVRKGQARKQAFRNAVITGLREQGIFAREEKTEGLINNANLVIGNVRTAEFVITAHYDTCAELPFPNLVAPLNWPLSILFQIFLYASMFAAAYVPALLAGLLGASPHAAAVVFWVMILAVLILVVAGPSNPNTMNDNTSGVVTLLTLVERMPPEMRKRVAIVLFDNEEIGLVGSSLFSKRYKRVMEDKPLINLDCIGDGEHVLFSASKAYKSDEALYARTRAAFQGPQEALHVPASKAFYPSDQLWFKKSLAVAVLNKRRFFGYMLGRIHTRRDTVLNERNVDYLVEGLMGLIGDEDE